jgi:hypothetical protein
VDRLNFTLVRKGLLHYIQERVSLKPHDLLGEKTGREERDMEGGK